MSKRESYAAPSMSLPGGFRCTAPLCLYLRASTVSGARRFTKVQARRDTMTTNSETRRNKEAALLENFLEDRKKKAKIGDAGFEFHSGWPMPGEKNYRKNVMQDATLAAFEKELERKDMSLEDYMKQKPEMREMDRCGKHNTSLSPRRCHCPTHQQNAAMVFARSD